MTTIYVSVLSLIGLFIHVIANRRHPSSASHLPVQNGASISQGTLAQRLQKHLVQYGGLPIVTCKAIRLVSTTFLIVLAILTMNTVHTHNGSFWPPFAETAVVVGICHFLTQRAT